MSEWLNQGELFEGEAARVQTVLPAEIALFGARPNPFNPRTTISFALPEATRVRLAVYDLGGRLVAVLEDGVREAGLQQVTWDASGMPSGLYFCRLEAGNQRAVQKLMLMK